MDAVCGCDHILGGHQCAAAEQLESPLLQESHHPGVLVLSRMVVRCWHYCGWNTYRLDLCPSHDPCGFLQSTLTLVFTYTYIPNYKCEAQLSFPSRKKSKHKGLSYPCWPTVTIRLPLPTLSWPIRWPGVNLKPISEPNITLNHVIWERGPPKLIGFSLICMNKLIEKSSL